VAKRTASAKKQARAGARRTVRNRGVRSEVKTLVVKARRALNETPADGLATATEALRALDRAAAKGILHPNNAGRRKGRLARQLAKLSTAAPAPAKGKKAAPAGAKAAPAKAAPAAAKKK
jgi:small subunit ribosomal protein S20